MTTREDVYLLFNMRTLRRSKTENQTRSFNNAIFILTTCFHSIPIRVTLSVCVCVESHCVLYPTVFYLCVLSRPFAICVTSIVTDAFTVYEYSFIHSFIIIVINLCTGDVKRRLHVTFDGNNYTKCLHYVCVYSGFLLICHNSFSIRICTVD